MPSIRTLIMAGALVLPASSAFAQMYPGQSVTVNPYAIGAAPYTSGESTIHLHRPVHHRAVHHPAAVADAAPPAATPPATTIPPAADTAAPAPPPPKHHATEKTQTAAAAPPPPAPAPAAADTTGTFEKGVPFSFDGETPVTAPPPQKQAAKPEPATKVAAAEPPPAQTAPVDSSPAGFTKRGEILFTKNATDPAPAQFDGLKLLAGDLSAALKSGASRIQLQAYGGNHGDKGSDARRLSLKRALSIRQVLIDNGVPSDAIDVRAMGGVDDTGPADRVDVYVRAS